MAHLILDRDGIDKKSGLVTSRTSFDERLKAALDNLKSEEGMVLIAVEPREEGTRYIFKHETD